jgi:hypothetical protein
MGGLVDLAHGEAGEPFAGQDDAADLVARGDLVATSS